VDEDKLRDVILGTIEVSLDAQLRAVRRLRSGQDAMTRNVTTDEELTHPPVKN
jgi:hypothetical protein